MQDRWIQLKIRKRFRFSTEPGNQPDAILAFERWANHGGKGANIVTLDATVKWVTPDEFRKLKTIDGTPLTSFVR